MKVSVSVIDLLRRLRANYPDSGDGAPMQQQPREPTLRLWKEVDDALAHHDFLKMKRKLRLMKRQCYYCRRKAPFATNWIEIGGGRVSCGLPTCVAF